MIADNVTSLRKLITLCTKMKKLKALVNASTTFCHNDKGHIEEIVYPCSTSPSNIITLAETLDSEYLEMIKGGLIGRTSNEYLFTKTLAETLLATEGRSLPVCMVRIPLVAATMQDPFPGWIDGIGGIVGFVLAVGTGVMRNGILDPAYVTEALPADMVVSCLIAAGWATAVSPTEECTVYNMVSASDNRAPPAAILGPLIVEYTRKTPFSKFFREPSLTNTRNKAYIFMSDIWNMLQAYAMDILMGNIRNNARSIVYHRRRILQLYRNMRDKTPIHLSYDSSNVICLWGRLSNAERQVFNFDRKLIDWPKYLEVHCLGVKRHVMKDDMSKVEEARLYLKRWCLFWTVIQMAVVASILLLLYIWVM